MEDYDEIEDDSTQANIKRGDDRYFAIYYNSISKIFDIKYVKDVMVLLKMAEMADYNTGIVRITSQDRIAICDELSITKNNISAIFKRLRDIGIITGERGSFCMNPKIIWKGDSKTRRQIINTNLYE